MPLKDFDFTPIFISDLSKTKDVNIAWILGYLYGCTVVSEHSFRSYKALYEQIADKYLDKNA